MNIAKVQRHVGVDIILKRALGDYLSVYKNFIRYDIGTEITNFYIGVKSLSEMDNKYDVIIVDDLYTHELLQNLDCKKWIWYCHGTYEKAHDVANVLKSKFKDMAVIFPNNYKKGKVVQWFGEPKDNIILEISLPNEFYAPVSKNRNGKVAIVGKDILNVANIYAGFNKTIETIEMLKSFGTNFDIIGINYTDKVNGYSLCKENIKDFVIPLRYLKDYSVVVFPSGCPSIGFCLFEIMAAGVPVIITPKEGIGKASDGISYFISDNAGDIQYLVKKFIADEQFSIAVGKSGQNYMKNKYNFDNYRKKLTDWVERW